MTDIAIWKEDNNVRVLLLVFSIAVGNRQMTKESKLSLLEAQEVFVAEILLKNGDVIRILSYSC